MITGTERAFPSTDGDTFANEGLTIKQHMMIEFTTAIISASLTNNTVAQKIHDFSENEGIKATEYSVIMADEYATALIKQFNKNGDK